MSKPLAAFDIDGTVFRSSLYIEFVHLAIESGVFTDENTDEIFKQHEAWLNRTHRNAYLDYVRAIVAYFNKNIRGVSLEDFERISEQVVDKAYKQTYVYTRDLIHNLSDTHFVVAISGSPRQLVEKFTKYYPFDYYLASELEVDDANVFTGGMKSLHTDKELAIEELMKEHDVTLTGSIAVGDSKGDIGMLNTVERAIAFNPEELLLEHARDKYWDLVIERKNVNYELRANEDGEYVLA